MINCFRNDLYRLAPFGERERIGERAALALVPCQQLYLHPVNDLVVLVSLDFFGAAIPVHYKTFFVHELDCVIFHLLDLVIRSFRLSLSKARCDWPEGRLLVNRR